MSLQHEPSPHDDRDRSANPARSGLSGPSLGWILTVVVGIIIVLFVLGNGHEAEINFLLFHWRTTVRFAILVAVLLGVVLDRVFDYGMKRRKKRKLKEKLKDID
ncbi:MAG: hypothetical protein RLZ14_1502 [Actinomycetota bacterium]